MTSQLLQALEPLLREADRLERDYGLADRPAHQLQPVMLSAGALLRLRAAAQAAAGPKGQPYTEHVSAEPLEDIRKYECEYKPWELSRTSMRFRRLWNEILRLAGPAS